MTPSPNPDPGYGWVSVSRRIYRWRTKFGGMDPKMAKQLQALQKENSRLKKLVADQALDR